MKIAIIAPLVTAIREPQRGGSQAFVSDLARGLGRRGHDVHVYAASGSHIPGAEVIDTGIDPQSLAATLYRASAPAAPDPAPAEAAFASVYAKVRGTRYDVVHNHAFDAPAITLATGLGAPVVHTLHLPPDGAVAAALRQAGRGGEPPAVAAVSAFQARAWRQAHPGRRHPAPARAHGLDRLVAPDRARRRIRRQAESREGSRRGHRHRPRGGNRDRRLRRRLRPRLRPGADRPAAGPAGRDGASGGAASIAVGGDGRAAVVLYPAGWDEPFGMAAAEAQACGTPVVAFRRGALGEVIADGLTGFLVPPGDMRAAAEAVGRTAGISRPACRDHAEAHLDLEQSLAAHEQLYRRVAGPGAGAQASA